MRTRDDAIPERRLEHVDLELDRDDLRADGRQGQGRVTGRTVHDGGDCARVSRALLLADVGGPVHLDRHPAGLDVDEAGSEGLHEALPSEALAHAGGVAGVSNLVAHAAS